MRAASPRGQAKTPQVGRPARLHSCSINLHEILRIHRICLAHLCRASVTDLRITAPRNTAQPCIGYLVALFSPPQGHVFQAERRVKERVLLAGLQETAETNVHSMSSPSNADRRRKRIRRPFSSDNTTHVAVGQKQLSPAGQDRAGRRRSWRVGRLLHESRAFVQSER